jgi:hypothetical protein
VAIFRFKDNPRLLKLSLIISSSMFALFNLAIYNITGMITNSVIAIIAAINLNRFQNDRKEESP